VELTLCAVAAGRLHIHTAAAGGEGGKGHLGVAENSEEDAFRFVALTGFAFAFPSVLLLLPCAPLDCLQRLL